MNSKFEQKKEITKRFLPVFILMLVTSILFVFLIYDQNFIFGSELGGWVYHFFQITSPIPLWIPAVVLALTGVMVFAGGRWVGKFEPWVVLGVFCVSLFNQILLQRIYPYPMFLTINSDTANSFFSASKAVTVYDLLSKFPNVAFSFAQHARTNMPGKILFYKLLELITSDPQILGYLIIGFSALGGVLFYAVTKRIFRDKKIALYSFILFGLIPCKQVFFPILNTVTPLFILLSLYLLLVFLDSKKKVFLVLLGISLYLLVLFEPSPLVTGLIFAALLVSAIGQKKIKARELLVIFGVTLVSFGVVYAIFKIVFSFDLWNAFQYEIHDAIQYNLELKRSKLLWMRENLKEFFYGAGVPVMTLFIFLVILACVEWKHAWQMLKSWSVEIYYLAGVILTLGTLLVLGINLGEITRLWIYLAVFFQVPAAWALSKMEKSGLFFFLTAAILIAQITFSLQNVIFIMP